MQGASTAAAPKPVEVLIHNVSHKDLLMSVCRAEDTLANDSSGHERCRRARPAFNAFNPISRALYRLLEPQDGGSVAASAELDAAAARGAHCETTSATRSVGHLVSSGT